MALSPRTVGLRRNLAWNLVGESVYSLTQWLLLVAVARFGSPAVVGDFALALAIAAPVFLLVGLNLRVVQATDSRRVWALGDYLRVRHLLSAGCVVACLVVAWVAGLDQDSLLVVLAVAAAKVSEALSQTYYGHLQRSERLDVVARSLLLRAVLGAASFVAVLAAGGDLVLAVVAQWLAWTGVALLYDRHAATVIGDPDRSGAPVPLLRLVRKAAPLGLDAGVSSLIVNLPRYVLAGVLGVAQLGIFASLAYLAQSVSMVTGSMANTVLSRLAAHVAARRRHAFVRLLAQLTGFGAAVGALGVLGAVLVGGPLLEWVLGPEYADVDLLVVLMLSAALTTVQRCLGRGLQAAHRFGATLAVDVAALAVVAVSAPLLISSNGVLGAAWSLCLAFGVTALMEVVLVWGVVRSLDGDEVAGR